jgi:hypothetical protein
VQSGSRSILFEERVRFRAERGLGEAVAQAARRARTSSSEYLRQAARRQLEADGIALPPIANDGVAEPERAA